MVRGIVAPFLSRFRHAVDAIKGVVAKPQNRRDAFSILVEIDTYRNLHTSVAILSFFVAAGFGVLAFFLITESLLWIGVTKQIAVLVVSLSWVLIFPIWALVFLLIMSLLGAMGIKDVRSLVRHSLSNLTLNRDQRRDLDEILASRRWRHADIFKSVVDDLKKDPLGF